MDFLIFDVDSKQQMHTGQGGVGGLSIGAFSYFISRSICYYLQLIVIVLPTTQYTCRVYGVTHAV